jgi:uncharacterized protein
MGWHKNTLFCLGGNFPVALQVAPERLFLSSIERTCDLKGIILEIFITGGTGLVGRHLVKRLIGRGDQVVCLSRNLEAARSILPAEVELIEANPVIPGDWQSRPGQCDAVINLAGAPVFDGFWTRGHKRKIRRSRLSSTFNVIESLENSERALTLINASAVGYYGDGGNSALSEVSQPGDGFLARLACEWEHTASQCRNDKVRVAMIRIAVVLSAEGGALPKMVKPFNMGFGGHLGNGRQYFPWIHIHDLVETFLFVLDNPELSGPINASVPTPPTQKEFTRALAGKLKKPALFPVSRLAMKLFLGQRADALLQSQRVVPNVLKASGFRFKFDELDEALDDLL